MEGHNQSSRVKINNLKVNLLCSNQKMFSICWVGHQWSHKSALMGNLIFWDSVLKPIQQTRIRWILQLLWAQTTILFRCSIKLWWQVHLVMTKNPNNSNNLRSNNQIYSRQTSSSLWVSNSALTSNSNNHNSNSSHNMVDFKLINSSKCLHSIKIQWWVVECLNKTNSKLIHNQGSMHLMSSGLLAVLQLINGRTKTAICLISWKRKKRSQLVKFKTWEI